MFVNKEEFIAYPCQKDQTKWLRGNMAAWGKGGWGGGFLHRIAKIGFLSADHFTIKHEGW